MLSLRVTREQDQLLGALAERLGLSGKAEVLRRALDYWLEHAPEAQGEGKQERKKKGES
jgi:hypothetical protein